ncbi:MRP family ATP-binding protein, partial [Singulisphaera rosea]
EQLGVPFLGEVPLNVNVRERGDEGKLKDALAPGSASRPYLLGVVEQLAAQISIQNIKTPKMPKLEILN